MKLIKSQLKSLIAETIQDTDRELQASFASIEQALGVLYLKLSVRGQKKKDPRHTEHLKVLREIQNQLDELEAAVLEEG